MKILKVIQDIRKSVFFSICFSVLIAQFNLCKAASNSTNDTIQTVDYKNGRLGVEKYYVSNKLVKQKNYYYKKNFYGYTLISAPETNASIKTEKEFYKNGKMRVDRSLKDGKLDGAYKTFYDNGNPQCVCNYKEGKRDSVQKVHYDNGQLWGTIVYSEGKPSEVINMYDKNGKSLEKGTLKDGNGTLYVYTPEGKLEMISHYKNGKIVRRELKNKKALIR